MADASSAQLLYIERLLTLSHSSRLSVGDVISSADASDAIERLQRLTPIQPNTRSGVFASLKTAGRTKDDLYIALGIDSLAAASDATEYDGARARRWIDGFVTETRRGIAAPEILSDPVLGDPPPREGLDDLSSLEASMNGTAKAPPVAASPVRPGRFPARHRPAAQPEADAPTTSNLFGRDQADDDCAPPTPMPIGHDHPLVAAVLARFPQAVCVSITRRPAA